MYRDKKYKFKRQSCMLIYMVWKNWNIWYNNYDIYCLLENDNIEVINIHISIYLIWGK